MIEKPQIENIDKECPEHVARYYHASGVVAPVYWGTNELGDVYEDNNGARWIAVELYRGEVRCVKKGEKEEIYTPFRYFDPGNPRSGEIFDCYGVSHSKPTFWLARKVGKIKLKVERVGDKIRIVPASGESENVLTRLYRMVRNIIS